jgi:hypothetical protein
MEVFPKDFTLEIWFLRLALLKDAIYKLSSARRAASLFLST